MFTWGEESSEKGQEFILASLQPIGEQDDLLLKASTLLFSLNPGENVGRAKEDTTYIFFVL